MYIHPTKRNLESSPGEQIRIGNLFITFFFLTFHMLPRLSSPAFHPLDVSFNLVELQQHSPCYMPFVFLDASLNFLLQRSISFFLPLIYLTRLLTKFCARLLT